MNTNHETRIKWLGLLAWLSVCGMAFVIVFVAVKASTPPVALDSRGCAIGRHTPAHLVVLLDATDPLTPKQIAYVGDGVRAAMNALPPGALVELYRLEGGMDLRGWTPFAAFCLPDNGEAADGLTQNPRLIRRKFQETLNRLLDMGTEQIARGASDTSPILEALNELATRFDVHESGRQLLLVSDLLEHSAYGDQYRDTRFPDAAATLPPEFLVPTLRGTAVAVLYLYRYRSTGREQILQPRAHKRWWLEYLQSLGATVEWYDETAYGRLHTGVVVPQPRQR